MNGTKPPLRYLPEPKTREQIIKRIALLEERLNGGMDEAIMDQLEKLREKLAALGREAGS
jgi:hypothetical protein